jgi:prephenate dehydrogenase
MTISTISTIGGRGAMGRFFQDRFTSLGIHVLPRDKPLQPRDLHRDLEQAELVLLAVPIQAMEDVLAAVTPALKAGTILADICSVKVKPLNMMLAAHKGPVVGTHPLFGPEPGKDSELRVSLVPGRNDQALKEVRALFEQLGLCPFTSSAEEHDRALAYIQGLNYVTTVSYLAAFSPDDDIARFLTPSFQRRLQAARKMLTQDGQLFTSLFEDNPYSHEAVRHYRSFLNLAAAGEVDLLRGKADWWWQSDRNRGGT